MDIRTYYLSKSIQKKQKHKNYKDNYLSRTHYAFKKSIMHICDLLDRNASNEKVLYELYRFYNMIIKNPVYVKYDTRFNITAYYKLHELQKFDPDFDKLNKYKKVLEKRNNIYDTKECPICLETISDKFTLDCNHSYCIECIYNSLSTNKSCPMCREPITEYIDPK